MRSTALVPFAALIAALALLIRQGAASVDRHIIIVGSKAFTESVILGEIVQQSLERSGLEAEHRRQLGGSRVLFDALREGQIDVYPEYQGTLYQELLGPLRAGVSRETQLERLNLTVVTRLGFSDSYVLGTRAELAARTGLRRISDLRSRPQLRLGFSNEFLNRADGWIGLKRYYDLPQQNVAGLDHQLAYRALVSGDLDVTDFYSTDPEIVRYGLKLLEDDRGFFPNYDALLLARSNLPQAARAVLQRLEHAIDAREMARMNALVTLDRRPEAEVAHEFVDRLFGEHTAARRSSRLADLGRYTAQHLMLTAISLGAAVLIGLPLGIIAAQRPRVARVVLGGAAIIQTVPSMALLVFMIPLLGIGFAPAAVALFLYSLLPIVRNTCTGLLDIPRPLRESAQAMGLTAGARLRLIELPLATRSVLAGIKTAAVINIGTATLGALIGAGGYGQPILAGIRLNDVSLILEGAIPAAALALLVQWLFDLVERLLLPPPRQA
jgi:osmoprotectant transport system permease protein